jgi:dihydroorotate dehydrogenase
MPLLTYARLKTILFKLDPETAHTLVRLVLRILGTCPIPKGIMTRRNYVNHPILRQELFGQTFANPVGLAAGFDKDGDFIPAMPALGFGFAEIGTVTPKPQPGNPKPRLFRHVNEEAIQNAMGFNNKGAWHMIQQLKKLRFFDYPIGINIGKNKTTPEIEALSDYESLFKAFKDYGTYIVINISSPNTPGLRDLQNKTFIREIFRIGREITDRPILLKIAPDMEPDQAVVLCRTAVDAGATGIIATNTSVDYTLVSDSKDFGGISGQPLKEKSFTLFRAIAQELYGQTTLISVGGIDSAAEAYRRIRSGASLVQIYTGLIYQGPSLIREINEELVKLVKADGFGNIIEAIGADLRNH